MECREYLLGILTDGLRRLRHPLTNPMIQDILLLRNTLDPEIDASASPDSGTPYEIYYYGANTST